MVKRGLTRDGTQEGEPLGVLSKSTNNIDELLAASNRQKKMRIPSNKLIENYSLEILEVSIYYLRSEP